MTAPYIIYGQELSYFTRKLEAAFRFYGAPFEIQPKRGELATLIEQRSGTHQIPVLQTPENWMIGDTTPLIALMDSRYPQRRMFPPGALGVLVHVLEEHFDEWIARTMVHYRWHYPKSAEFASTRMAEGNAEIAARVRDWGPRACRATGTASEKQQRAAEAEYERILQAMDLQLSETPYLLGHRPTALDCVVLGGLRAHTNMDPDPKAVTARYPRVIEWCEQRADTWNGDGALAPFPQSTAFARFLLSELTATYVPYVTANREAQRSGAKAFHINIYDEEVSFLSRPYIESSRQMIRERIHGQLTDAERREVSGWLQSNGLADCFD